MAFNSSRDQKQQRRKTVNLVSRNEILFKEFSSNAVLPFLGSLAISCVKEFHVLKAKNITQLLGKLLKGFIIIN